MIKTFNLGNDNKIIIDQFNIIDNTIDDEPDHHHHRAPELDVCKLPLGKADSFFDFILPIAKKYIHGLGFWNLWTTRVGHIYNGTFIFGPRGWITDGFIDPERPCLTLIPGQFTTQSLGYVRCDPKIKIYIFLEFDIHQPCELKVIFNQTEQCIKLKIEDKQFTCEFSASIHRVLRIECISGKITLYRIDCFNFYTRSIFFDENRVPSPLWKNLKNKW